jgi:hypothetical protein
MSYFDYLDNDYSSESDYDYDDYDNTIDNCIKKEMEIMSVYNKFLNFKENSNTNILRNLNIESVKQLLYPDYEYVG